VAAKDGDVGDVGEGDDSGSVGEGSHDGGDGVSIPKLSGVNGDSSPVWSLPASVQLSSAC
jgi:hypothetical protein